MNKIISLLLIVLGTIAGFFLLVFGMAKFLNGKKRSGIFFTTIILIFSIFGCKTGNPSGNNGIIKRMKNIDELYKTDEWKKFKEIWKTIDSYGDFAFMGKTISTDEIKKALDNLEKTDILLPVEIEILRNVTNARLESIHFRARLMVMHIIPQMSEYHYFLSNLEAKIDVLNNLKNEDVIDQEEYNKALSIVKTQIEMFSVMDVITKKYYDNNISFESGDYFNRPLSDETCTDIYENNLKKFENDYNDFIKNKKDDDKLYKDLEKKYKETKSKITEVKKSMKVIYELIDNLENE